MDLKNTYWLLRHGHSLANAKDLIVSNLENGVDKAWGLSDLGRQQADAAGEALLEALGTFDPSNFRVFASPYSRTVETALQVGAHLEIGFKDPRLQKAEELRERYFGSYDLKSASYYTEVWAEDAKSPTTQPPGGGESVIEVAERLRTLIESLEEKYSDSNILLVSHGDALSILASLLLGTDLREHRQHGLGQCEMLRVPLLEKSTE